MENEKRLIPLQKRIIYAGDVFNSLMSEKGWPATEAADFVKAFRTVDAVSRGVHDQVRWERDVAIEQLESYGISFGEKAEVAKVVHGRWDVSEDAYMGEYVYQCSICKSELVTIDGVQAEELWKYCPECGAKMDGDGNG